MPAQLRYSGNRLCIERLRRRLSFSLCMLPDSAQPEQYPILLKIIHLLKSYQHHVHNFIPDQPQDQPQPSLTTRSSRLTFSPRKTTGPMIRGSAIILPLKFGLPSSSDVRWPFFSSFWATSFIVQCINLMEDLKLLFIDRFKSKGMEPSLVSAFLKTLTYLILSGD